MLEYIKLFLKDEEGASAVEYGLVVGLLAIAIVAIMTVFAGDGGSLSTAFDTISGKLETVK